MLHTYTYTDGGQLNYFEAKLSLGIHYIHIKYLRVLINYKPRGDILVVVQNCIGFVLF